MFVAKVSSIGQISIPIGIRKELNISGGSKVQFIKNLDGRYELVPSVIPVTKLKGMLGKPLKTATIEEMNLAIARQGEPL